MAQKHVPGRALLTTLDFCVPFTSPEKRLLLVHLRQFLHRLRQDLRQIRHRLYQNLGSTEQPMRAFQPELTGVANAGTVVLAACGPPCATMAVRSARTNPSPSLCTGLTFCVFCAPPLICRFLCVDHDPMSATARRSATIHVPMPTTDCARTEIPVQTIMPLTPKASKWLFARGLPIALTVRRDT